MDYLHSKFEEQLELMLDKSGNAVIGEAVFSPVAILGADPTAYEDEYSKWLSEQWLPEQSEALEQILDVHVNRKRFTDLCLTLKNGQLIPLVGSGMSAASGIPIWSVFLRKIRHHSSMNENDLEDLLSRCQYEEAAERLAAAMPDRLFDERIEHELRIDDPSQIRGAVALLPSIFDKLAITTNLDDLLERIYHKGDLQFSHILSGHAIGEYRKVKATSERTLLKLHGDCRSRTGRVLGKCEYDIAYAVGAPVREELTSIYRNHSILCLGCSLNPDRTVGLLAEVAKMDPGMPKHYAFLPHPKDNDVLRQREHFLTERDIFPIWYPSDHDESIQALFVGMMKTKGSL